MLRSVRELLGFTLLATDGEIGKVDDFYFDDQEWTIRYLVVKTGTWLTGRQVLVSPVALGHPDWKARVFPVGLTKEQIEKSPDIEADKPVSRQQEADLLVYYSWSVYGMGVTGPAAIPLSNTVPEPDEGEGQEPDSHLRSTEEVIGYHVQASDGEAGRVEDLLVDDEIWAIGGMVVDTRDWRYDQKLLVTLLKVQMIDWTKRKVHVAVDRDHIRKCPYDPLAIARSQVLAAELSEEAGDGCRLEKLERRTKTERRALLEVPSLGPKRVETLFDELGILSVDELRRAAKAGKIRGLRGFGEKIEDRILGWLRSRAQ